MQISIVFTQVCIIHASADYWKLLQNYCKLLMTAQINVHIVCLLHDSRFSGGNTIKVVTLR